MLELAVVGARLLQYGGATVLFGSSLFFVYAAADVEAWQWARRLVAAAALLLAIGSLAAIAAQASLFAGSFAEGLSGEALGAVIASMALGKAALVRATCAAVAFALLLAFPAGRPPWRPVAALGAVAAASLAWMGHGTATEGTFGGLHLASDILHALAAAAWVGALAIFSGLLLTVRRPGQRVQLHAALNGFSGIGTGLVAVLVLTGLVNAWVLIGPDGARELFTTLYGRLLLVKLALFAAMLALAARNRFRLTPGLGRAQDDVAIAALRRSVGFETAAAFAVLAIVAWLGTLAPSGAA
jgi:copper resistance protein D